MGRKKVEPVEVEQPEGEQPEGEQPEKLLLQIYSGHHCGLLFANLLMIVSYHFLKLNLIYFLLFPLAYKVTQKVYF